MADTRRYGPGIQLDIAQILLEAQNRWLRPAEICEILRNYENFRIAPEPPHLPSSGSLFLFDRKVLRYFRKDGHIWRKKKDGKTVKEAHERLKAGSIDVLHCYYAHGEENENFQRRSYWLLEEDLSHIVLVHYREVKGNRTNFNRSTEIEKGFSNSQEIEENLQNPEVDSSASSRYQPNGFQSLSQNTDVTNPNSGQASEYEDVESVHGFHSFEELRLPVMEKTDPASPVPYFAVPFSDVHARKNFITPLMEFNSLAQENGKDTNHVSLAYEPQKQFDLPSWEAMLENCTAGIPSVPFQSSLSSAKSDTFEITPKQEERTEAQFLMDGFGKKQEFSCTQVLSESDFSSLSAHFTGQKFGFITYDHKATTDAEKHSGVNSHNDLQPCEADPNLGSRLTFEGKANYSSAAKQHLLDRSLALTEGLNKIDSFSRWMSRELEDVNDSHVRSNSKPIWDTVESENGVDDHLSSQIHLESYMLAPSLSHDQLFSIIDFSPNWAYAGCETKILITGKFLKNETTMENCNWSCMFGEVEVPAEVVTHGILRSRTPLHKPGRVHFYITCSNRLASSEVREFEFRIGRKDDMDVIDIQNDIMGLQMRLAELLTLNPFPSSSVGEEASHQSRKIGPLLNVDDHSEWLKMMKLASKEEFSVGEVQEQLLENILKENLQIWLLQKVSEGGRGACVLDEEGHGVLHLAAALGYDWAIPPTLDAGVSINFRDVNGWTALHWAAYCGRERTVVLLTSLGAAPGLVTDPTPRYPSGRTPADLASANGHKGISGYLGESTLSDGLSSLNLKETTEDVSGSGMKAVQAAPERIAISSDNDLPGGLSMKDSLAAVCNATQAAARIHQAFRVESFRRKQMIEYGDNEFGMSDDRAISLIALKTRKPGLHGVPVHAAAIRIQNKFRSWKGRKDFLIARRRIVRIQAHFRGHQVRKNYKKILWSVGIVEKVILRWRRKGTGLRGFKSEALGEGPKTETSSHNDDDYDFLKEGRKQTEERFQKALARVKSMAQYPEGRDQYRRLLTAVTEIQETKAPQEALDCSEGIFDIGDDLVDLEELLDDDTFIPMTT